MAAQKLRWGIIGLGNIAHAFVQDLQLVENANLSAVASRSMDNAQAFAQQYEAPYSFGNYQKLIESPEVDIIYIATPHNSHADLAISALSNGKHVLCEKPLAVNQQEVKQIIQTAEQNGLFFMEAFWSRFNPSISEALDRVRNGEIGTVNYVNADFTFYRDDPDHSRMRDPNLAGGSLLEIGVYPLFLNYIMLGVPKHIKAIGNFHHTGVDLQIGALLEYENAMGIAMSGFRSQSDMRARICGTKGSIFIDPIWHETQSFTHFDIQTNKHNLHARPTNGKGFTYEIEVCHKAIEKGKTQSDQWSWNDSLQLIKIADEIRQQLNYKFPFES